VANFEQPVHPKTFLSGTQKNEEQSSANIISFSHIYIYV
jgi:hypothetical protein